MKIRYIILLIIPLIVGCAGGSKNIVLLPEERIYTFKAGNPISLELDGKPIDMTFAQDMKIVSPTTLIKQEQKLNDQTVKKIKAEKSKNNIMKLGGGIIALLTGLMALMKARKK